MERRGLLLGFGGFTLLALTGCSTVPRVVTEQAMVSDGELRRSILKSAADIGWTVVKDIPGRIRLRYTKQSVHTLVVDVTYKKGQFVITPVAEGSSLIDEKGKAHRKVNSWTQNLARHIREDANRRFVRGKTQTN